MHGLIFLELKKHVEDRFSTDVWKNIVDQCHLNKVNYNMATTYPDKDIVAILNITSEILGESPSNLLESFGDYLAPRLLKSSHLLINPNWTIIDLLENSLLRKIFNSNACLTCNINRTSSKLLACVKEECPSGLRSTLGKRVYAKHVPWVRIPPPPTLGMI
jgi:hypothetical protein